MKWLLTILTITYCLAGYGQITIDSTRTTITIREKAGRGLKTLTIYRSFVQGSGVRHQIVYQPTAEVFGEEPETLRLSFADELTSFKKLLDIAMSKRSYNFSKVSVNVLPYADLTGKLVQIYSASADWGAYVKGNNNLTRTISLYDGTQIIEVAYDAKRAGNVLSKSDFAKEVNDLFGKYGYTATPPDFPEEHHLHH